MVQIILKARHWKLKAKTNWTGQKNQIKGRLDLDRKRIEKVGVVG